MSLRGVFDGDDLTGDDTSLVDSQSKELHRLYSELANAQGTIQQQNLQIEELQEQALEFQLLKAKDAHAQATIQRQELELQQHKVVEKKICEEAKQLSEMQTGTVQWMYKEWQNEVNSLKKQVEDLTKQLEQARLAQSASHLSSQNRFRKPPAGSVSRPQSMQVDESTPLVYFSPEFVKR